MSNSMEVKEPKRRIAPKTLLRFKKRDRERTKRNRGVGPGRMVEQLSRKRIGRRNEDNDPAVQTAGSPHGPWHFCRSTALSVAMPDASLGSCGILHRNGVRTVLPAEPLWRSPVTPGGVIGTAREVPPVRFLFESDVRSSCAV
ncbi:hypothetical protein JCM19992_06770 [Thermostilla marina]